MVEVPVTFVTALLVEAGSSERLYGMYSFNDAHVILLTEEMYRIVRSAGAIDEDWLPNGPNQMTLTHET